MFPLALVLLVASPEQQIRQTVRAGTGVVQLPPGIVEISSEIELPSDAHDLEIRGAGSGTTLRASDRFSGRAIFIARAGKNLRFTNFVIDGNREKLARPAGLPPSDVPFSRFTANNGLLVENVQGIGVSKVQFRNVAGFAVLVSHSSKVQIEGAGIEDSGSQSLAKRNNATGGILLEEGTTNFEVLNCNLKNIRGNGIWTHSLYTSPRNSQGRIAGNRFLNVGRDAIQIGHATHVRVEENEGEQIGYPIEIVDVEHHAIPVGIDTSGNTEQCQYLHNRFEEVNGKCIDLDGFHDGEIRGNTCRNTQSPEAYKFGSYAIVMNNTNPDMRSRNIHIEDNVVDGSLFGGIFVIGTGNTIAHNLLSRLNLAHCETCYFDRTEPELLKSGIYLGKGAERADIARDNVIEDNRISGYKMSSRCIGAAPGVSLNKNTVRRNNCSDEEILSAHVTREGSRSSMEPRSSAFEP
ncbi:MAG: right-handed parallel beta-helix repeat-containing protein [Bryobacteraceae bacterium]